MLVMSEVRMQDDLLDNENLSCLHVQDGGGLGRSREHHPLLLQGAGAGDAVSSSGEVARRQYCGGTNILAGNMEHQS